MRLDDWQERFSAEEESRVAMAWSWAPPRHDCLSGACALLQAMTGKRWWKDCMADFAGGASYATELGAARIAVAGGGYEAAVSAALDSLLGERYASVREAHRGDPAIVDGESPFGVALGVVDLTGLAVLVASPAGGWARVPLGEARAAWPLPF